MPARHYSILNTLTSQVSGNWPAQRVETSMPTESFVRYNAAAEAALEDIALLAPEERDVLHAPAPHGIKLLFRYCHIATLLASKNAISSQELSHILHQDDSFAVLDRLMEVPLKVTSRVENELGLVPMIYPIDAVTLRHWKLDNQSLTVPRLRETVAAARYDAALQGHEISVGECPARRSRIMMPLFQSVVKICETDENLFARSLEEDRQTALPLL